MRSLHADQPPSNRRRWAGPVVAMGLLLAFWLIFWPKRFSPPTGGTQDPRADLPTQAGERAAMPAGEGEGEVPQGNLREEDRVPMPGCWQGLREFDQHANLADMRAAIAAAVEGGDPLLATYLREKLAEMIGADPTRAQTVLAWAKNASGAELGILLGALKDAPAVRDPGVADKLLSMGEDKTGSPDLRSAALDALETQHHFEPAALGRMKEIALDGEADSAAWMATRTIGRVMKEDFQRTGVFEPYWKELLEVGKQSEETAVQILALEMPSYADPVLRGDSIAELAELLKKDPDRSVREMAAHRLSVTREPDRVLAVYREAFPAEKDECVRWAIFRFTARVAGGGALTMLAEFAAADPRFKEDHDDFMALYASGTVDFARIWMGKVERHQCVHEEGMGH
ncbi:HEAT repeat domain-containing protein [Polyangium aurulentum]|uniref:HEAT repeat domain-containing protein n=1 Tax=Polyangium aurulentum TaxID=2567896 RepID=UPI001F19849D|nr:HEAT repeat domain-containing protein [Polyangium aurulentum]